MKAFFLLNILFFSLNLFATEVGEEQKSTCLSANQEPRESKIIPGDTIAQPVEPVTISK